MHAPVHVTLDNTFWLEFNISKCKYLVPGMSHDIELLIWVHILQM